MQLRALEVREQMGARLVLRIDPQKVGGWIWSELPYVKAARNRPWVRHLPTRFRAGLLKQIATRHPYVLPASRFPDVTAIKDEPTAQWVTDLVLHHRDTPRESLWFHRACDAIERDGYFQAPGGPFTHPDQAARYLMDYFLPIVDSIERDGYRTDLTHEVGFAILDADGAVLKTKRATHRFFIARALGTPIFPVQVAAVHETWWHRAIADAPVRRHPPEDWPERLSSAIRGVAEAHQG